MSVHFSRYKELFSILESPEYSHWKKVRKDLVLSMGPYLLALNESELSSLFLTWENHLKLYIDYDESIVNMSCLLVFSVIHYFRRSFDQIKKLFPLISRFSSSSNREVVKAFSRVLKYLVIESKENVSFLKESAEAAQIMLSPEMREKYLFNAFTILEQISKLCIDFVLPVTNRHAYEITNAICSTDRGLCKIAAKLFEMHLRSIPERSGVRISKDMLIICNEDITKKVHHSPHGPVMIIHIIFKVFPSLVHIEEVIDMIIPLLHRSTQDVSKFCYNFLFSIMLYKPSIFTQEINTSLFDAINKQILRPRETPVLLQFLKSLIKSVPHRNIPFKSLCDIVQGVVVSPNLRSYYGQVFDVVCMIFDNFPGSSLNFLLFAGAPPSITLVKALKRQPHHFKKMEHRLRQWSVDGLSKNATYDSMLISLEILKHFGMTLYSTSDAVYEQLVMFSRSSDDRIRYKIQKLLSKSESHLALQALIQFAVFDPSKKIRLFALSFLTQRNVLRYGSMLLPLLGDSSFKVRRAAIPIISKCVEADPIILKTEIVEFMKVFLSRYMPYADQSQRARGCTILPLVAEYFIPLIPTYAPHLIWFCVTLLLYGDPFPSLEWPKSSLYIQNDDYIPLDLKSFKLTDHVIETNPFTEKNVLKHKIFTIENEKKLERRDQALFQTLELLSKSITQFIPQVIPVFIRSFQMIHNSNVTIVALSALTSIVIAFESKIKLTQLFPELYPSLMYLLSGDSSDEVAIAVLKLIGTIGSSGFVPLMDINEDHPAEKVSSFENASFYPSFILSLLVPLLKDTASPVVFEAVTGIFAHETEATITYIEPVMGAFQTALETGTDFAFIFRKLEAVIYFCGWPAAPYICNFFDIFRRHLLLKECLHLLITVSYQLRSGFNQIGAQLYPLILSSFSTNDNQTVKKLLKLASYLVLFQNQAISTFIHTVSKTFFNKKNPSPEPRVNAALKTLTVFVQYHPMDLYGVQITQLCFQQLRKRPCHGVYELLLNLCLFGGLDIDYAEQECKFAGVIVPHFSDVRNHLQQRRPLVEQVLFIKDHRPRLNKERIMKCLPELRQSNSQILKNFPEPFYNNTTEWIDELSYLVVMNSPEISIISCSSTIEQFHDFRKDIFPIAFLSCWKQTNLEDRKKFSQNIELALIRFDYIDPDLIYLSNVLDRAGIPFDISDSILAGSTYSSGLALYQLERCIRKNPGSSTLIERLLRHNSKIGRLESARGLLTIAGNDIGQSDAGRWFEQLGEWEKALDIYLSKPKTNVGCLVRCYANLEQWDNVRQLRSSFDMLPIDEKSSIAIWFAFAFFHSKDMNNTEYFVSFFEDQNDHVSVIIRCLYYISSGQYKKAIITVENGFKYLIQDRSVFGGSDANQATRFLVASQHFVELQETVAIMESRQKTIPAIWENRLQNFSEDSDSWTKLIDIRSLLLSPADHIKSCVKMISVLRKERKWRVIDSYFGRLSSVDYYPSMIIEKLKIMWSRGEKIQSINQISVFSKLLSIPNKRELERFIEENKHHCNEYPFLIISTFFYSDNPNDPVIFEKYSNFLENMGINNKMRARVIRLQAHWQYTLYKANTSSASSLTDIIKLFDKSKNINAEDYRAWSGWAYASSRALSHYPDQRSLYAINAITGFLMTAKIRPSESLQYLCQMFSIFVRYGEYLELPRTLESEMIHLPPDTVIQIIPQIIVHIAHPVKSVRDVVDNVITNFCEDHFEAVVYSLNVLSLIPDDDKSNYAKEMQLRLSSKHAKIYKDAILFIDGMHRSAVCWYESWIDSLGIAFRMQQQNDQKGVIDLLSTQYESLNNPKCEFDHTFKKNFKKTLDRTLLAFDLFRKGDQSVTRPMWESFRLLYSELCNTMKHLDAIYLPKISDSLANKRGFSLSIPGTYDVNGRSPRLQYIEPRLELFNTQHHPRLLFLLDSDGKKWKFLLKGNEDIRLDQRIMQFFSLINSLLKINRYTNSSGVCLSIYAIIPFAPNAGLISWVTGADTMQQLVAEFRTQRDISVTYENQLYFQYSNASVNMLSALQRLELFNDVSQETTANELRESIWMYSPAPSTWIERIKNFTVSTAQISMAGYVIGLGDRHPSNIMIQRHTGRVIHIDFGESFETATNRLQHPELVPFRMTRMIENALEGSSVEGSFRRYCEDVLWVLREHISPVIAQLEIFMHEPIFSSKANVSGPNAQHSILSRVSQKLSGDDFLFNDSFVGGEISVNAQVTMLISSATDKSRYCRHYFGWCPLW